MSATPKTTNTIQFLPPRTLSAFIASHQSTISNSQPSTPLSASTTTTVQAPSSRSSSSTTTPQTRTHTSPSPKTTTSTIMPFRRQHRPKMVESQTTKPTLLTRLRGRNARTRTVKTTTTVEPAGASAAHTTREHRSGWGGRTRANNRRTAQPAVQHHHRRHASIGDKISGGWMKLKGSLTRRPGVKAAGTRRMHGTDGRGSRRVY